MLAKVLKQKCSGVIVVKVPVILSYLLSSLLCETSMSSNKYTNKLYFTYNLDETNSVS